jgi:hypothetical protein
VDEHFQIHFSSEILGKAANRQVILVWYRDPLPKRTYTLQLRSWAGILGFDEERM